MTPRWRSSRSLEPLIAAALIAAAGSLAPSAAHAQACCVGTGLVTPARLRMFEDYAVGMQTSFRNVMGSFASSGNYVASPSGDREVDLEQDLLAATRFGRHIQVALKVPFVETGRSETASVVARRLLRVRRRTRRRGRESALRRHVRRRRTLVAGHRDPGRRLGADRAHRRGVGRSDQRHRASDPTSPTWASPSSRCAAACSCR